MYAIEVRNLSKNYTGKSRQVVQALKDLNFTVSEGEVFGFLGPNGAGKSTTIKTIMGQLRPTGGSAYIFNSLSHNAESRKRVGYLPENPAFYDFLTAREYLHFVGKMFGLSESRLAETSTFLLEMLDLSEAADRPIRGYSKGMVQRLGLAQTMVHDPDLYILDEPMSGLDPIGRALVKDVIKKLKQRGKTIFFSTHITSDIEVICDRVGIVSKGRLMVVDHVSSILRNGIEGYLIQINKSGHIEEVNVEVENLQDFLANVAHDAQIERIEPIRKDMEAFFLNVISQGHTA